MGCMAARPAGHLQGFWTHSESMPEKTCYEMRIASWRLARLAFKGDGTFVMWVRSKSMCHDLWACRPAPTHAFWKFLTVRVSTCQKCLPTTCSPRGCAVWYMIYDIWHMIYGKQMYDVWYMIYGMWYMIHNIWCMGRPGRPSMSSWRRFWPRSGGALREQIGVRENVAGLN